MEKIQLTTKNLLELLKVKSIEEVTVTHLATLLLKQVVIATESRVFTVTEIGLIGANRLSFTGRVDSAVLFFKTEELNKEELFICFK